MKLALLSSWDFNNPRSWSGVIPHIVSTLSERVEVTTIQVPATPPALIDRALTRAYGTLQHTYLPDRGLVTPSQQRRTVQSLPFPEDVDAVISLAASIESLGAPQDVPLIQVADTSFQAYVDTYLRDTHFSRLNRWRGISLDRQVARRSQAYSVASDWSAAQIRDHLSVKQEQIVVNPFGPGVAPTVQRKVGDSDAPIRALFVASNWKRKGGDLALEAFLAARKQRKDLTLTIVGDAPEIDVPGVTLLPRVDQAELSELYCQHDLLLEPSRFSAGGVTITDAICHGLPVLATKVGGIPTIVREGKTGWLARPVRAIPEMTQLLSTLERADIEAASTAALTDARERLNWDVWADQLVALVEQVQKSH